MRAMVNIGIYRILAGKHEGKRPVRRLSCTWYNNIKMYGVCVDWIHLAEYGVLRWAVANTAMISVFQKRRGIC
jgi:hypothetical protein